MPRCYIALGGNVGDVGETFRTALAQLDETTGVAVNRVSSVFSTPAVGQHAGGTFHNAAAEIDTSLDPWALLDTLQELERKAGRTSGPRWRPRPLDLDLIFYEDRVIADERLQVPHPACWYRRFVLDPLDAIAGDVRHPLKGVTVDQLRTRLLPRPLQFALAGFTLTDRERLGKILTSDDVEIQSWRRDQTGSREPAIVAWLGSMSDCESADISFESLPIVPRLDVSLAADVEALLRDVIQSALG